MIAGVETAGIVLAVLPLVIEALDRYRNGLRKTRAIAVLQQKDRERLANKIEQLRLALVAQRAHFSMNLKKLILTATKGENFEKLPVDYDDRFWRGQTGLVVEEYLRRRGDEVLEAFRGTIQRYEGCLKDIAEKLKHVAQPSLIPKDSNYLTEVLRINGRRNNTYRFSQRIGFVMSESDIEKLILDLRETTLSIRTFVDDSDVLESLELKVAQTANTYTGIIMDLYKVRKQAHTLYVALNSRWRPGCHEIHDAMLCLDSRCRRAVKLGRSLETEALHFQILFKLQESVTAVPSWHETSITILEEVPALASGSTVLDICTTISRACQSNEQLGMHLCEGQQLSCWSKPCNQIPKVIPQDPQLLSLGCFLSRPNSRLQPLKRIDLAAKLASSLLQFNGTPWFRKGWRKDDIHFFEDHSSSSKIDVDHPLISEKFPNAEVSATRLSTDKDPELDLLELGIMLLEIWHRRTFESWVSQEGVDINLLQDIAYRTIYGTKWFKSVKDDLTPAYRDVVGVCVRPQPLDQFETSWEDPDFRHAFYTKVIMPLLASLDPAESARPKMVFMT